MNWTPTTVGDGHLEYINNTCDIRYLKAECKKYNINLNNYYNINPDSVSGYTNNKFYQDIFRDNILNIEGKPGFATLADTWGLHRGTPVKKPRLVTWVRYTNMKNTAYILDQNRIPSSEVESLRSNKKLMAFSNELDFLLGS